MNKNIYFKKGYFYYFFIPAFIMLIIASVYFILALLLRHIENDFVKFINPILSILCLFNSLLLFILTYQIIKLPFIIFKDDEIIQYIGVFRRKNEIKINDIVNFETLDFKTDICFSRRAIKITLINNEIKRLRLGGISKSDMEYIINLLKEEYNLKLIPRV